MSRFTLYRQLRNDGGLRTGLEMEDCPIWETTQPGPVEDDPALRWYVDLRGEGDGVPTDRESVREWLAAHVTIFAATLVQLAERFETGIDFGGWPVAFEVPGLPDDAAVSVVIHAARRVDALEIAAVLSELARSLPQLVARIPRPVSVGHLRM